MSAPTPRRAPGEILDFPAPPTLLQRRRVDRSCAGLRGYLSVREVRPFEHLMLNHLLGLPAAEQRRRARVLHDFALLLKENAGLIERADRAKRPRRRSAGIPHEELLGDPGAA